MEYRSWQQSSHGDGGGMQFAMPGLTPMVKKLLIVLASVWGVSLISLWAGGRGSAGAWPWVRDWLAIAPGTWRESFPLVPIWQIVTYGFLHDVFDPTHILFNALFIYFLGTMMERELGSRRFLTAYLGGVLVGGVAALVVTLLMGPLGEGPEGGAIYPFTIGASGGVFTIVVGMATLRPDTRLIFIIIPMTLKVFALIYVGINVFMAASEIFNGSGGAVSWPAHLGGAAFGFVAVKQGWVWKDPVELWQARQAEREVTDRRKDEEELDRLLERIQRDGINSLSSRERAFLKRVSKRRG